VLITSIRPCGRLPPEISEKTMRRKSSKSPTLAPKPLIRLRHFLIGIVAVCLLIAGPLLAVGKQVYVRNASIRKTALSDSLAQRRAEVARLKQAAEKLSCTQRIETFARIGLGLEYPAFGQITVMRPPVERKAGILDGWEFFAILKRSITQDRG
jgi:hypothetical protein